nr:MFS transporter [Lachnospiraceae bacterium]
YIDGVGTIIDNCINIGTDLNLNTIGQVVTLLATQVVAFGGSLVFAKLSKKYETVNLILVCIVGYFFVCLYALTLKNLIGFAILAFGVGCFQGSIQSLSRSYFSKIIPPEHSGEYFGIYDIFSKGASFLGSAVIAAVKLAGGTINVAVATMAVFFALGFVLLKTADKIKSLR